MKKIYVSVLLCLGIAGTAIAQNRSINFEVDQPWQTVVDKAKQANKYIFFNAGAAWCGPCRTLERDVFTRDEVADFFNANFINVKYDMEKGHGIDLRHKYSTWAYPTLLWINPNTEEVVHRVAGGRSPEALIALGKVALGLTDDMTLRDYRILYEQGKKTSVADLTPYLTALGRASMGEEQSRIVLDYLKGFTVEQLMIEENWNLLQRHVSNPFSEPMQKVFANREQFIEALGADRVNRKISSTLQAATNRFVGIDPMPSPDFDEEGYNTLLEFLKTIDDPISPECIFQLQIIGHVQHDDFVSLIHDLEVLFKSDFMHQPAKDLFIIRQMVRLDRCTDKAIQEKGLALMDYFIENTQSSQMRRIYNDAKTILLERFGDIK